MLNKIKSWFATSSAMPAEPWARHFSPAATPEDIFHCFRLLLGRNPNREEWLGHAGRAGENLEGLVAGYLRSLEFAKRGLLRRPASEGLALAEVQGFRIYVAPDDMDVGRHVQGDNYETYVMAVFRRLLRPGMGVIDIGANIGYFTMLSASIVGPSGYVLAIEPNPDNARMLEASRRVNGYRQVTVAQVAAARETGLLVLNVSQSNGTTAPPSSDPDLLLAARTVPAIPVDALAPPTRRIDLIKVDVEGAEYVALAGCEALIRRDRPAIISEFSPDAMQDISGVSGPEYLRWLLGQGYRIGVIAHDGTVSDPVSDPAPIMAAYAAGGSDHLDLLATHAG
jgi:FkbM family methyltransferase